MEHRLKQLIRDNASKFQDWIGAINSYNETHSLSIEFTTDEMTDRTLVAANALAGISEIFFKYGGFKDKFDNSKMYLNFEGPCLIIKSSKTDNVFYFGIGNKGLYLNTYLRHTENLRYMDDLFYRDISLLNDLGVFELVENESYSKSTKDKYPTIFNNNKSVMFRLMRNYFIGSVENERDISFGDLQVSWTHEVNFNDILSDGCLAFKILYKLNYELWKINDLKTKKGDRNK